MEENKYLSYPEGYEQLAKDLDMPFEDINMMDFRNLGKPGAGEMGFDAATLLLCDSGLFGPVEMSLCN